MNKITTPTKLLVGSFIILIVLLVNILPKNRAQSNLIPSLKAQKSPPCDQTTAGSYGFSSQGVIGFGTPQSAQAVETGLATADGAGNPFRLGHLQPERTNLKHAVHRNVSSEPRFHDLRDNCLRLAGTTSARRQS